MSPAFVKNVSGRSSGAPVLRQPLSTPRRSREGRVSVRQSQHCASHPRSSREPFAEEANGTPDCRCNCRGGGKPAWQVIGACRRTRRKRPSPRAAPHQLRTGFASTGASVPDCHRLNRLAPIPPASRGRRERQRHAPSGAPAVRPRELADASMPARRVPPLRRSPLEASWVR